MIFGCRIIGTFIYYNSLTSERYLNLRQNNFQEALENISLAVVQICCMLYPDPFAIIYPKGFQKRIGIHLTRLWPAWPPDLTPLDLCFRITLGTECLIKNEELSRFVTAVIVKLA